MSAQRFGSGGVRSEPLESTRPIGRSTRSGNSRIVGLFALIIGVPFWLEAARFTRDGWINFVNWLCVRFGIPYEVPALDWRVAMALLVLIGTAYSYVEIGKQPIRWPKDWRNDFADFSKWRFERRWEAWLVWAVLIVSDVWTTYSGAKHPDPSGLAIMRDVAAASGTLAIYAILMTFIPDRLVRFGRRALFGG